MPHMQPLCFPLVCIVLIYWQMINQNHKVQRRVESFLFSSACAGIKHFQNFDKCLGKDFYNFIQEYEQVLWIDVHQIY